MSDWIDRCSDLLANRRNNALFRERRIVQPIDATHVQIDQTRYVNFASNDYLGLTHHPRVLAANRSAASAGSGAAGLITGYTDLHARCESLLAQWKGTESAILFPSGYQANLAAVQALAAIGEAYPLGARFLVDKLAHASLIDAVRATQSPMRIFPHNGMTKLRRLLEACEPNQQLQIVLTESIFSMDGDAADLHDIAQLKQEFPFVLVLDEAHGSGVYGPGGAGFAAEMQLQQIVDVSVVTLSKAIGCMGGAVCSVSIFRDALLNFGRAYIYSTSAAPAIAACVEAAIHVMRDEPHRQQRVRRLAREVRAALIAAGMQIPEGDSPIIPIVLGSEETAMKAAEKLNSQGLLVLAVRPPTVAPGASRLRITLSCKHTDAEVDQLLRGLKSLR